MKKTLLLTLVVTFVTHCIAQQTGMVVYTATGFEADDASMTFTIDNPEPRIGDWSVLTFCFTPLDSMIKSGVDTGAFSADFFANPCFNLTLIPKDTGLQTIGPLKFNFNSIDYITDTLVIRVIPEMKPEPGCSIRFLMMDDYYIVVVEEVKHAPVRYITVRDSFGRKHKVDRAAQRGELAELDEDAVNFCGSVKRFSSRNLVPDEYPKRRKSKSWMLYSRSYTFNYSTCQRLEPDKKYFRNLPENVTFTISDYRSGE